MRWMEIKGGGGIRWIIREWQSILDECGGRALDEGVRGLWRG